MRFLWSVVLGLAAILSLASQSRADDYDLVIITPHNAHIQDEFERAFVRHTGKPVRIRWIKQGTSQLMQLLQARDKAVAGDTFEMDVFFGGGVPDHTLAMTRGYLEAPNVSSSVLEGIPPDIAGYKNYDDKRLIFSSAISSFGILCNKRGMETQKLAEVKSWEDLADPRMYSWVILADPRKSASVQISYEMILQQYGWEKGWPMLMQMAANARTIADSSSAVPNEVASGNVLAGPCIDFFAKARIDEGGSDVLSYVMPQGGTAINPDPISMLRKPPHREMAEKFISFVLSTDGQRLWILPPGTPGGPEQHALYRMAVRPDVYSMGGKANTVNPYEEATSGRFRQIDATLQERRVVLLGELMGVALVDQHRDLTAAWKAMIDGGMKPAAVVEWNKLPFTLEESLKIAADLDKGGRGARKTTREWSNFFRQKYEKVTQLSK